MKKQDVISGILCVGLSLILYTQTFTSDAVIVFEDNINPMQYPRALIALLAFLGSILTIRGLLQKEDKTDIPIFSRRTLGIMVLLLVYAAIFNATGFFVSSVIACFGVSVVMGWRRLGILFAACIVALILIWALYTYILRIPLPTGTLF